MKEKYKNQFKITISYQGHAITVDLRKIVAINHPKVNDKYFCVYFDNMVWKVAVSEHDSLYKAWMTVSVFLSLTKE